MHPDLIAPLVRDRFRTCPCGARTDQTFGLCRKCHARVIWRRRRTPHRRRMTRRLARRGARFLMLDLALSCLAGSRSRAHGNGPAEPPEAGSMPRSSSAALGGDQ
jgi:hypothetical protein